jgi:hypothetical protein
LVVGSCSAAGLAAALREKGKTCDVLSSPFWSISRARVEQLAGRVKEIIKNVDPDLIIMQLLDTSSFYVKRDDGGRQLPKKGDDDILHIDGDIVVCTRDVQHEHLHALRPLFDVMGKKQCVWIAPMPRYVVAGCCDNTDHAPNRRDSYYLDDMWSQLEVFKRNLKDHIHGLNKKNVKVADPSLDLRGMTPIEIWGTHPTVTTGEAMAKIAAGALLMAAKLAERQQANQQSATPRGGGRGRARSYRGGGRGGYQHQHQPQQHRHDHQDNSSGRWQNPSNAHGGRVHSGGHREFRARPY